MMAEAYARLVVEDDGSGTWPWTLYLHTDLHDEGLNEVFLEYFETREKAVDAAKELASRMGGIKVQVKK
ncbi:hypothetical protein LCGC14_0920450 [marine sediment metagenome]|uniref:Uncharacterized protein n=1 Tax=marine sediment metagenome TaxID=412755 RepID=A0A0F9NR21_9ZZZZ